MAYIVVIYFSSFMAIIAATVIAAGVVLLSDHKKDISLGRTPIQSKKTAGLVATIIGVVLAVIMAVAFVVATVGGVLMVARSSDPDAFFDDDFGIFEDYDDFFFEDDDLILEG